MFRIYWRKTHDARKEKFLLALRDAFEKQEITRNEFVIKKQTWEAKEAKRLGNK